MSSATPSFSNDYYLCPLSLLDCFCESVDLVEGIQIRRTPPAFVEDVDYYGIKVKFVAVLPYNMAKTPGVATKEFKEKSDLLFDLVSGLRLCHAGKVITGPLLPAMLQNSAFYRLGQVGVPSLVAMYPAISTFSSTTIFDLQWPRGYPFEYELQSSDVPTINEIVKEIRSLRKEGKANTLFEALTRFNSAYQGAPPDRLIDQMIAFESLYIGDDKELGYKLALRIAFLLADEDKRKVIFGDMKQAYTLRGQIVHGNKRVGQSELEKIIPKTEEYLRQSIRKFLALSKRYSLKEIREHILDENILKNGKLLAFRD